MTRHADVVICGAGIAGIAAAYSLAVTHGVRNVILVDDRAPLTLTSDKSTEAYRNWWPGPDSAMVQFMNRNIDLLERHAAASGNRFLMNRRGYVYTTTSATKVEQFRRDAMLAEQQGAGDVREFSSADTSRYQRSAATGFTDHPTGADLFTNRDAIREQFGWLAPDIVGVLHARRCGWFSGQQLGMYLLEEAKAAGVSIVSGRVNGIQGLGGRAATVSIETSDGRESAVETGTFVNAAGPFAKEVALLTGTQLPVFSELHLKVGFEDVLRVVDRNTGLVILDDEQMLEWTSDEREDLASSDDTRWMTETMPAGIHLRPEGYHNSNTVLMLWDYHSAHRYEHAIFPLPDDPFYPEVVMRGMVKLVPGMSQYVDRLPRAHVDGGYYTKTAENRPLVGPLDTRGAYVIAAFSGFGLMAAPAAGELLAAHVTGAKLPEYASAFHPARYQDERYRAMLANWGSTGQL
jgi:sarcosine oxidase, subunit beta